MSASLRGKTIAFSGSFANKSQTIARALRAGAQVSPNVSRKIDFLVKGDSTNGMKEAIAKYNGTKIVSANSFINFVQRGGAKKVARASATPAKPASAVTRRVGRPRASGPAIRNGRRLGVNNKVKAVPTVTLASIYADKSCKEIEKMEKEAATFGPMPWQKGSKFQKKQAGIAQMKKTKALKAKAAAKTPEKKASKAKAEEATPEVAAPAAVEAPKAPEAPVQPKVEAAPAIAFNPSKGLSIEFKGDFADFCRAANQLVVKKESSSATTVVEKI